MVSLAKVKGMYRKSGSLGAVLGIAAVFIFLSAMAGCSKDADTQAAGDPHKAAAVPVTVAAAVEKTVPVQLRAIGNVQAISTVSVKAQVEGELVGVHFKEGQEVKAGDLLFTIDPRTYEAQLKQAEANLAKDRAQLQNAKKQVERYGSVVEKGYVSKEQYDKLTYDAAALEASVKADEAASENAKIKLSFCTIRSPFKAVAGSLMVHKGSLIKANDNDKPLVVLNQVSPVYVAFSIPERNLPEVRRFMEPGKLEVLAIMPGDGQEPLKGHLAFIENTVDTNTGTIMMKAVFPNENKMLWPGLFVNVVLNLTTQPNAIVIPSQALQTGQQGQYVFVVKDDQTVDYRPVVVGRTIEKEVVITKGVGVGEKVVTDGQLRLASGSLVKVVDADEKK